MYSDNSNSRSSFFDDDDLSVLFEFLKPNKNHQKDLNLPPILSSTFSVKSDRAGFYQQGLYVLHNRTLAYYKVCLCSAFHLRVLEQFFTSTRRGIKPCSRSTHTICFQYGYCELRVFSHQKRSQV